MVQSPVGGCVLAECQSYALDGLQRDKKGNRMPVPSQTQGVVQRPITPHVLQLHMFGVPRFPKYKLESSSETHTLLVVFNVWRHPETYVLLLPHTFISEILFVA